MVNVDIGDGYSPVRREILSSWPDEKSALSTVKCEMPLGIAVDNNYDFDGRKEGFFDIIRVEPDSNGEKVGVKVGDTLRACNSVMDKKVIEFKSLNTALSEFIISSTPTFKKNNVRIANPITKSRSLFMADNRTFESVQNAINSNLPDRSVNLVLERRNPKAVIMKAGENSNEVEISET